LETHKEFHFLYGSDDGGGELHDVGFKNGHFLTRKCLKCKSNLWLLSLHSLAQRRRRRRPHQQPFALEIMQIPPFTISSSQPVVESEKKAGSTGLFACF